MFKNLCLVWLCAIGISSAYLVREANLPKAPFALLDDPSETAKNDLWSKWGPHIMEFADLIEVEKVLAAVMPYLKDPEVANFIAFVSSPEFKKLIGEFESMREFKEAVSFLASKGYSVEPIIEFINSLLGAPSYQKPKALQKGKGISGLLKDIFAVLPTKEIKELFIHKKETVPEIAELFDIITSKEFVEILRRMKTNPKFIEFKEILENYGFHFDDYCKLFQDYFGKYYQGIFCESY